MKRFSAQFVITNSGPALKRAVITTDDDGRIISIEDTGGNLKEQRYIEFYNGIIIPGFVNCHCHLELSHLRKNIPENTGLLKFIEHVRNSRTVPRENITAAAESEDRSMFRSGVSLCADICNTADTFQLKAGSGIRYHNFIEVFGIDPSGAEKRVDEALFLAEQAREAGLEYSITPHSFYSVSEKLFSTLLRKTGDIVSLHFMESPYEREYLLNNTGPVPESYIKWGFLKSEALPVDYKNILSRLTGNLILVHNTFIEEEDIGILKKRPDTFFCLCINSNNFIENSKPPLDLLLNNGCEIVIGTDSLASNRQLSIMNELINLQLTFPDVSLTDLVRWATLNGAAALNEKKEYGTIEEGKKPGLVLLENVDLLNMKILPGSTATRLI